MLITFNICTRVADMGEDDGDKCGLSRAVLQHQDATSSGGSTTKAIDVGAATSRGGAKRCYNCRGLATSNISVRRGRVPH